MLRASLFAALLLVSWASGFCPQLCSCPPTPLNNKIDCNGVFLSALPFGDIRSSRPNYIDLSHNNITTLKNYACMKSKLLNMKKIDLNFNGLHTIEEMAFHGMLNLSQLHLAYNNITWIPGEVFDSILDLTKLNLRDNIGLQLPEAGFNLPKLTDINLANCGLKTIPSRFFYRMRMLRTISLHDNNLTTFNQSLISNLEHLHLIILRGNHLSTISTQLLSVLPRQLLIDFTDYDQPLSCHCNMSTIYESNQARDYFIPLYCSRAPTVWGRQGSLGEYLATNCTTETTTVAQPISPTGNHYQLHHFADPRSANRVEWCQQCGCCRMCCHSAYSFRGRIMGIELGPEDLN